AARKAKYGDCDHVTPRRVKKSVSAGLPLHRQDRATRPQSAGRERRANLAMSRSARMGKVLHAASMQALFECFVCEFRFSSCCFKSMPRNWLLQDRIVII